MVSSPRYILYISSYSPATGMPCFLPSKLGFKTPSSTFSYNTCHELGLNLNLQFLREAAGIKFTGQIIAVFMVNSTTFGHILCQCLLLKYLYR